MLYLDPEDRLRDAFDRHRVDLYNITKDHNFSRDCLIAFVDRARYNPEGYKPEGGDIYSELKDLEMAQWFLNVKIEELRSKIYDSLVKYAEPVGEIYDPGDDLEASEYAPENYVPKNNDPELRLKTEDAKMDSLPIRTVDESHDF